MNESADTAIAEPQEPRALNGVLARIRNMVGAPRRQALTWLRPKYVEQQLAMRKGDCNRCGLCCQLVFKCGFLRHDSEGLALCGVYKIRPSNCRVFPIDQRDIDDVNRLAGPGCTPCGYTFKPRCSSKS